MGGRKARGGLLPVSAEQLDQPLALSKAAGLRKLLPLPLLQTGHPGVFHKSTTSLPGVFSRPSLEAAKPLALKQNPEGG